MASTAEGDSIINAPLLALQLTPTECTVLGVLSFLYTLPATLFSHGVPVQFVGKIMLTLKVLVTTIDAQWEGMGDVGSARYEPALLPPCPTIRVLSYSNL